MATLQSSLPGQQQRKESTSQKAAAQSQDGSWRACKQVCATCKGSVDGAESYDHEMAETELCWTVLSGLPHSFGMISTVLMAQEDDLVLDTMLPQLMQVEQQHCMEQQEAEVSMFGAMTRMKLSNRDKRCFKCGKAGHVRANCPEFGNGTRRAVAF